MLFKRIKAKITGPAKSEELSDLNLVCLMTDAETLASNGEICLTPSTVTVNL